MEDVTRVHIRLHGGHFHNLCWLPNIDLSKMNWQNMYHDKGE
jgi:hypothetical protein